MKKGDLERAWSAFMWAVIGFAGGTVVIAPLVLSTDFRQQLIGGMMWGGLPAGLYGFVHGLGRAPRES